MKLKVNNRHLQFFHNRYLTFLDYDGNLLRKQLLHCSVSKDLAHGHTFFTESTYDECYDFRKEGEFTHRTHLYYLEYRYEVSGGGGRCYGDFITITCVYQVKNINFTLTWYRERLHEKELSMYLFLQLANLLANFFTLQVIIVTCIFHWILVKQLFLQYIIYYIYFIYKYGYDTVGSYVIVICFYMKNYPKTQLGHPT